MGTHAVEDVVLGVVEIDQNVAGVEVPFPGVERTRRILRDCAAAETEPGGHARVVGQTPPARQERVFGCSRESNESDNNHKAWRPVVGAWLAG